MDKLNRTQQGFVAIFSVIIIMMVMTLIAMGYATLAQRAQRRTLDNQLSMQAYYAAESGVNDAISYLENVDAALVRQECNDALPSGFGNPVLDSVLGVEYTCVLVTNASDLMYSNTTGETAELRFENGDDIASIVFEWTGQGQPYPNESSGFTPASSWGNRVDVLRVDLTPYTGLDRNALITNTYSFFLYPTAGGPGESTFNNVGRAVNQKGQLLATSCANDNGLWRCRAVINMQTPAPAFYLNYRGLYGNPFDITITPRGSTATSTGALVDGQKNIDVTGKANDVLRRIQVRVPVGGSLSDDAVFGLRNAYGLVVGDHICKRYFVGTGFDAVVDGVPAGNPTLDSACSVN